MKKIILSTVLGFLSIASFACTNLIIGKKASADGSVFCTYNCDGFGFAAALSYSPAGAHSPSERLAFPVRGENGEVSYRYIPQVAYTYGVVGLMNDHQVSIVETTWDGRTELVDRNGLFDYFILMDITLQRSATAREAIKVIDELVQTYGYNSTGESFAICDKEEAWIFEIIGKGPDNTGAVWVARRVPDDCISAYANSSRIRQFPQSKKIDKKLGFYVADNGDTMYSAECISFAREKGYFTGKDDADFSFREAYGPIDFSSVRYCDARVWSFFRHHYDKDVMDSYLPYLNGRFDICDELPLWIKPDAPLTERDVMNDMRDHYEGTALDMTVDVSAGPWASPYRNQPVNFYSSDSTAMFRERPIGCQQSGLTMVCMMRSWLPDAVGGVTYFNMDDATMVAYVPVYCGIIRTPEPFRRENNNIREFSTESAFWMNNWVANMIYPRWSAMIGDLRDAQKELEDFYQEDQKTVEERVARMEAADIVSFLTQKTEAYTDMMMKRWDKLAKLLIVKHNDQIMQPSENGELVAGRRTSPAYAPAFIDAVKDQTGTRYVKPTITK
ncbi:MAG: C69 family dipeptidase [Bacteroidales bacterium]|nr:C69 family dipeptidase [Bacteroidales bacterium]